ncbi:SH3 domain-containing protein [Microbacterium flavescens]|uniref:SH3 domain-containing protein n=1 Tax=Microbacterium flavescens TaxID=69366 RepID=UPI001BDE0326|nr:SH3 domain-containing protein [Microbacterium flavescens]BFF10884.1 hypothetical protein GCM10025699_21870 [Microbacterium flavescens]
MRSTRTFFLAGTVAVTLTLGGFAPTAAMAAPAVSAATPIPAPAAPEATPTPDATLTPTPAPTAPVTPAPAVSPTATEPDPVEAAPTEPAAPAAPAPAEPDPTSTAPLTMPSIAAQLAAAAPTPTAAAVTFRNPLAAKTYTVSSYFGPRCIPVPGASTYHYGVDLAARSGAPIYAIAAGTVSATVSGSSSRAGYISIRHSISGVTYTSIYMHIWSATTHVKVGQKVTAGQRISEVGNSGVSSGAHLHLELWRAGATSATAENAATFLKARGVDVYASATSVTAKAAPATCTYYTVGDANFRTGPSTGYAAIRLLPRATAMVHVPGLITSGFIPVKVGTQSGWVSASLVSPNKPAPLPAAVPAKTYTATAALAFKATASASGTSLGVIPQGAAVGKILASSGSWAKVTYDGKTGWVQRAYLTDTPAAPATPPATTPYTATAALAFKATASASGTSLGVIPKGAGVGKIQATSGSWAKVTYDGKTGWVQRAYLTDTPAAPATPPATTPYTATAALAFKATASASGTSLGVIPKGAGVGKIQATSGSWAKVTYDGKTGWVQRAYLTDTPAAPVTPPATAPYTATAALAFKATASASGTSLGVIPKGAGVGKIQATSGSWAKVTYNGKTGWVQRAYLTDTPAAPATPPATTPYTATAALAFKATASASGTSLGVIPKGAGVGKIQATSGSWAKVTYDGKTGWVQRAYLADTAAAPATPTAYTATAALAFKATASASGTSLGVIPKGAGVGKIQATSGSWAKVAYNGKTGWVQQSYLAPK